jgi:hypothetical protein
MSELSPETRAWIEAAGRGDAPQAEDRARIRHKLALELGAAAFVSTAVPVTAHAAGASLPASASAAAGKAGLSLSVFSKIAVATALAGAISTGTFFALRTEAPAPADSKVRAPHETVARERVKPPTPGFEPMREELAEAPKAGAATRKPSAKKRAVAKEVLRPSEGGIADELSLLRDAHLALRAGRPSDALRHTSEHAARFPDGALHEERAAVEMLARCAEGSASPTKLAVFFETAPESPLKARVRAACQGK